MQINSILIGGEEQISVIRKDATSIDVSSNGRASTARLEAVMQVGTSPAPVIPAAQDEVVIWGNQHADPDGVVANASFEDGLTGWSESGDVEVAGQNLFLHSEDPANAAWLKGTSSSVSGSEVTFSGSTWGENRIWQNAVTGAAGTFTATFRLSADPPVTLDLCLSGDHNDVLVATQTVTLTATPTDYSVTGVTATSNMRVQIRRIGATAVFTLHRAQLNEGTSAAPYTATTSAVFDVPDGARVAAIDGGQASFAAVSQIVGVVPYQAVTLSAQILNLTDDSVKLIVNWLDADQAYLDQSVTTCAPSATWDECEATVTAPESAMFATLIPLLVETSSTTGTAYVDDVQCTIGDVALFRGYVSRVEPKVVDTDGNHKVLRYALSCQDNTRVLDSIYVEDESYTNTPDDDIIAAIFYGSGISVTGVQNVATLDSIEFKALSLRQCLDRICDRTGAEWRLGFDDDLKYYDVGANAAPFGFAEDADDAGTTHPLLSDFGYQEEFSTPANVVNVLGYQAPQGPDETVTISLTNTNDDASVYFIDSSFPPGGGTGFAASSNDPNYLYHQATAGPTYTYGQTLLRFDTSSIPDDATVLSATLTLWLKRGADTADSDSMRIGADYYAWSPAAATSDYQDTPDLTPDAVPFFQSKSLTPGVYVEHRATLIGVSNISKTGFTGLRLYIDKADTLPPTSGVNNTVEVYARDGSNTARRPTLTVTYRPPLAARITGSHTDAASVALYGEFAKTITDDSVKTTGEADARAQVETDRYGYPTQSISCSYYRDGINVGDSVPFSSPTLGIDDTYIVKRLQMRWPAAQNDTKYTLELGQFRPDLVQFLRKGKTT